MGQEDPVYAHRYSHATVSRWESGSTLPSEHRIQVFGRTLGLSGIEVSGLISMAGLEIDSGPDSQNAASGAASLAVDQPELADREQGPEAQRVSAEVGVQDGFGLIKSVRFLLLRCLVPGALIAGAGYALGLPGWNADWMPVAYIALGIAVVLGQGFLFGDRAAGLREFYWVTLFLILTTPLLQFAPIRMDHYNFHTVEAFAGTQMPYMLALLVNLVLASSAGLAFHLLWRWQNTGDRAGRSAYVRAAWATVPPVGCVYLVLLFISNLSVWIQLAVLMPIVAAVFMAMLTARDPSLNPSETDRQYAQFAVFVVGIVGSFFGMATVLAIYVTPNKPSILPDHNLVQSWELNFNQLGFTREEALEMLNIGYLWHAICLFIYMFFVIGCNLLVAVVRMGNGSSTEPGAATASTRVPQAATGRTGGHMA